MQNACRIDLKEWYLFRVNKGRGGGGCGWSSGFCLFAPVLPSALHSVYCAALPLTHSCCNKACSTPLNACLHISNEFTACLPWCLVDARHIILSKAHLSVHHPCTAHVSSQHAVPGVSKRQQTRIIDSLKSVSRCAIVAHWAYTSDSREATDVPGCVGQSHHHKHTDSCC